MSIELPQPRLPQTATPRFLDFGGMLTPSGGGVAQQLIRPGRFALVVTYPRLKPGPDGRILMSYIRQAKLEGALFPIPEPGLPVINYGTPEINGISQTGSNIELKGFTPSITLLNGRWFSIIFGGRRYLHHAAADTPVGSDGTCLLPIFPMLRISPNDSATCEFAKPYIEGALGGSTVDVELAIAKATPAAITITEIA
ncbi:hypothetical protein [uncultured Sphingomonas sp.]|uniref:hypothetical protein n=1 Tax=uncultured Sphingomonas sp. TaxID=158754 RepID=UPI0026106505|nr:hypothetical protein [uncultured Sphingomonas sp.]